ncbi:hypothetical protein IW262DRAFT_546186 [Armillaria fumosa]|nr:hypothetical protein IW262DRAFT_546186 [Armillaria fumosa]
MAGSIPTFTHLVSQSKARQPKLAYLHFVEPRVIEMGDRNEHDIGAHEYLLRVGTRLRTRGMSLFGTCGLKKLLYLLEGIIVSLQLIPQRRRRI